MSIKKNVTPEDIIRARRVRLRDLAMAETLVIRIIVIAAFAFVVFGLIFGIAPMKGSDMEPELSQGDLLIYYRVGRSFAHNEIVIMERDGSRYVGRIIALPGETVNISDSGVINIDGNNIVESDIFFDTLPYQSSGRYPLTLGADEYFVLGDKRDTAKDSRYFGAVKGSEIIGRVITSVHRTGM